MLLLVVKFFFYYKMPLNLTTFYRQPQKISSAIVLELFAQYFWKLFNIHTEPMIVKLSLNQENQNKTKYH